MLPPPTPGQKKDSVLKNRKKWVHANQNISASEESDVSEEEQAEQTCPWPCLERDGDFLPAAAASRKPRLLGALTRPGEYPEVAQKQNKTGQVMVTVYLGASGEVLKVDILRSDYPELADFARDKLKKARYSPAYDQSGNPVPSRFSFPIVFRLL